jgi:predicted SAM-dependent methyltransferase
VKNTPDSPRPVWLNVGSSTGVLEGFVNLDNSPFLWLADLAPWSGRLLSGDHRRALDGFRHAKRRARLVRRDCRRPLPYGAGEVDHILCSHFLEYLSPPEMQAVVADFHRVLRCDGTLHIVLPDVQWMAKRYVDGDIDADQFQRELILHPEHGETLVVRLLQLWRGFGLTHRWMYDRVTTAQQLDKAGFTVLGDVVTPSSRVRAGDVDSFHIVAAKPTG